MELLCMDWREIFEVFDGFWAFSPCHPLPNAIQCPSGLALGRKVMTVEYYQLAICVAAEAVSANKVPEEFFTGLMLYYMAVCQNPGTPGEHENSW